MKIILTLKKKVGCRFLIDLQPQPGEIENDIRQNCGGVHTHVTNIFWLQLVDCSKAVNFECQLFKKY